MSRSEEWARPKCQWDTPHMRDHLTRFGLVEAFQLRRKQKISKPFFTASKQLLKQKN